MMVDVSELFNVLFYILLMVLIIALIVLVVHAIKTLSKVDRLVDDISQKSTKLNGVFSIIDGVSQILSSTGLTVG